MCVYTEISTLLMAWDQVGIWVKFIWSSADAWSMLLGTVVSSVLVNREHRLPMMPDTLYMGYKLFPLFYEILFTYWISSFVIMSTSSTHMSFLNTISLPVIIETCVNSSFCSRKTKWPMASGLPIFLYFYFFRRQGRMSNSAKANHYAGNRSRGNI